MKTTAMENAPGITRGRLLSDRLLRGASMVLVLGLAVGLWGCAATGGAGGALLGYGITGNARGAAMGAGAGILAGSLFDAGVIRPHPYSYGPPAYYAPAPGRWVYVPGHWDAYGRWVPPHRYWAPY